MATKAEKMHMSKVAGLGCIACRNMGYITEGVACEIHHIGNGTMGKRASNHEVIGLCHIHHRTGGYGVAVHDGRKSWEEKHGTEKELLKQTLELLNG